MFREIGFILQVYRVITVDVFAINGSAVLKKTGDGESVSFELPSGFYVLRVVSGKQVNVFRVSVR